MKVSIISFTLKGIELSLKIKKAFSGEAEEDLCLYTKCSHAEKSLSERKLTEKNLAEKDLVESGLSYVEQPLTEWTGEQMKKRRSLLFIGACGIAVRAIAPFLTDKLNDVPVLVMDEQGRFVIPVLAGHVGGANELAVSLAERMGSTPVITTATDLNHCFAVDLFARRNALHIVNKDGIAKVSSRILAGEEVTMAVEEGHFREEEAGIPGEKRLLEEINVPEGIRLVSTESLADVLVAPASYGQGRLLTLRPKEYVIGIGCKRGKAAEQINQFVNRVLKESGISMEQVAAFVSIDRKKDEEGILWMSSHYGIPFVTYSAEELQQVEGTFHASEFVKSQVGVDNVCERAALRFSGPDGILITGKQAEDGITAAIVKRRWSVSFDEK
ncbi:MAG: cobalamin biosynthesis protein [Lachnospiraceae bacterium]|nr:cobalamin biosynthesis protein [Lachnospiraceae bacterium]